MRIAHGWETNGMEGVTVAAHDEREHDEYQSYGVSPALVAGAALAVIIAGAALVVSAVVAIALAVNQ